MNLKFRQGADAPNSPDYAPKQIHAKGFASGYSRRELADGMNRLMGTGRLKRAETCKYANRAPRALHGTDPGSRMKIDSK